ncbi:MULTISPECIES: hypothetical protein [Streptomyces]|uniref:Secreted protein n=2 Tax=Streptomyces TaxID=1883 RepID=A0ABV9J583_9ACTN
MPRGRHRHSPPLHRLLPPSAIAGVSVVCALGPWLFTEPLVLRGLAAAAAVTAVAGAFVMRRWDIHAGKQVADLIRARAGDEWRFEERVAELEADLDESRELRTKLEQRLRAKRTELAGLRNEHAALLRRYATAETERASALEGRRLLEIESGSPGEDDAPALPAARASEDGDKKTEAAVSEEGAEAPKAFTPEGSKLFQRARAALARLDKDAVAVAKDTVAAAKNDASADREDADEASADDKEGEAAGKPEAVDEHVHATAPAPAAEQEADAEAEAEAEAEGTLTEESVALVPRPAAAVQRPSGHFTVPTAVAVVPATAPVRRPTAEGGFDFFGTKNAGPATLEAVQNEDLADVVGQEALALHKAEAESAFKPAGEESRGVGQVIDLTAHDETEHIDLQQIHLKGLRSAVS